MSVWQQRPRTANSSNAHSSHWRRDAVWQAIQAEAIEMLVEEPWMSERLKRSVLVRNNLAYGLAAVVKEALYASIEERDGFELLALAAIDGAPSIEQAVRQDLEAIRRQDPAVTSYLQPFLFFKGLHALFAHRIAHYYWIRGRRFAAQFIQSQTSQALGVDIHPAAVIGSGVFIDHATSVVIGETAVVGDHVVLLHEVTLGSTGKHGGDRHPKIGDHVMIGAGAKLLGNIRIGSGAKIGAGSVVLRDVDSASTVTGQAAEPREQRRPPLVGPTAHWLNSLQTSADLLPAD